MRKNSPNSTTHLSQPLGRTWLKIHLTQPPYTKIQLTGHYYTKDSVWNTNEILAKIYSKARNNENFRLRRSFSKEFLEYIHKVTLRLGLRKNSPNSTSSLRFEEKIHLSQPLIYLNRYDEKFEMSPISTG